VATKKIKAKIEKKIKLTELIPLKNRYLNVVCLGLEVHTFILFIRLKYLLVPQIWYEFVFGPSGLQLILSL